MAGHTFGGHVDVVDGTGVLHEVKSGYVSLRSSISRQIDKDEILRGQRRRDRVALRGQ